MPGPPPRGPGKTRRRNTETWTYLPADGPDGPLPPLPAAREWTESTREWWSAIWASPMATQWTPSDVPTLIRLAALLDEQLMKPDPRIGAEIRQLEDRFGLSPHARQKLRWVIADPIEISPLVVAAVPELVPATAVARTDPRRLRALPGAG